MLLVDPTFNPKRTGVINYNPYIDQPLEPIKENAIHSGIESDTQGSRQQINTVSKLK